MTINFKLPEISEGVESAEIVEIHVAEGDVVKADQIIMEIETEKAIVELPCPHAGRVTKLLVSPGDTVAIGAPLLMIEDSVGAKVASVKAPDRKRSPAEPAMAAEIAPEPETQAESQPTSLTVVEMTQPPEPSARSESSTLAKHEPDGQRTAPVPAAPSTRRLARELGINLLRVSGSGPAGRITTEDVQVYVRTLTAGTAVGESGPMAAPQLPDFNKFGSVERQPLSKLDKTLAANLSLSWQTVPHVTQHDLADITELESARKRYASSLGQTGPKLTMTAIMVKAVVDVLKSFPHFNASLDTEAGELVLKRYYHIGVAVDTEFGLVVPVIRDVERKPILELATELIDLAERARNRKLKLIEMQGGTFTITNLGGIGGTSFTPIVNYPEVAILGMSRSRKQIELVNGALEERLMLPLSLSYDHRVINGANAARFIVKLSQILSDYFQLLVES